MTSTKSSVKHTARYDFKRCIKENALIPMALTLFASALLWISVQRPSNPEEFVWTFFNEYSPFDGSMFSMAYLATGALTAINAFRFLASTKRCNVYLSVGIERKTLLNNRIITSVIFMIISAIVPLVVALIANKIFYSVTSATIITAIYISMCFLLNMLLGFSIAGAIMLSVGNVIEGIGIYALISMIFSIVRLAVENIGNNMFNGFSVVKSDDIFVIEAFLPDWISKVRYLIPVDFLNLVRQTMRSYSTDNGISPSIWLTLLCWFVICALIFVQLPKLMKKRKAEIAGAFGADRKLVAIVSGIIAFLMFTIWCGFDFDNQLFRYAMMFIMPVIGYIIPVVFIYRNSADIKDNLIGAGVTAVISLLLTVCSITNCFGYFNKLPSADEVEYAAIMPAAVELFNKNSDRTLMYNDSLYGKITDADDIKKIISIHDRVTDNLGKGESRVSVVYKLKNGQTIARTYRRVSDEGAKASLEFIDTKYYKNLVTDTLSLSEFDEDKEREKLAGYFEKIEERVKMAEYMMDVTMFELKADFTNSVPAILNSTLSHKFSLDRVMSKAEILEFKKALATDLTKMTVEQTFYPQEKPLYFVHFYRYDYVDNGSYENKNFPIYSFMSNTLNIINKYEYQLKNIDNYSLDDILTVQIKNVRETIDTSYNLWDKKISFVLDRTVCATYTYPQNYEDVVGPIYVSSDFDEPIEVTDKATIERYFNNYRSMHSFIGDNGIFVRFIFKDGSDLIAYIPEKLV